MKKEKPKWTQETKQNALTPPKRIKVAWIEVLMITCSDNKFTIIILVTMMAPQFMIIFPFN